MQFIFYEDLERGIWVGNSRSWLSFGYRNQQEAVVALEGALEIREHRKERGGQ